MNTPSLALRCVQISMVWSLLEYSQLEWVNQPWMFEVQVISAWSSQKPMVSPIQRGTSAPRRGTTPDKSNSRPIWTLRMALPEPPRNCTREGVTMMSSEPGPPGPDHQRMKPSGRQYISDHCAA